MRSLRRHLTAARRRVGRVHPRPVLVIGNQKSGTSAIAALLAARAGLDATIDIPGFWPLQQDLYAGRVSLSKVIRANRRDFSRAVVKEPGLTFLVPQLRQAFPDSPIVLVVRDPRDTLRSALDRLGIDGRLVTDPDPSSLPDGWERAFDQGALGIEHPDPIGRLALRWRAAAEIGLGDEVTVVRYEDFTADKLATIDGLAGQVGLARTHDITDLLEHAFQPRGRRDVDLAQFFGPRHLALIEELCGDIMTRFGYDVPVGAARAGGA